MIKYLFPVILLVCFGATIPACGQKPGNEASVLDPCEELKDVVEFYIEAEWAFNVKVYSLENEKNYFVYVEDDSSSMFEIHDLSRRGTSSYVSNFEFGGDWYLVEREEVLYILIHCTPDKHSLCWAEYAEYVFRDNKLEEQHEAKFRDLIGEDILARDMKREVCANGWTENSTR